MLPSTSASAAASSPSSALSPPPPPPPPPLRSPPPPLRNPALINPDPILPRSNQPPGVNSGGGSQGLSPSIIKISGIIALVVVLSASIHFLLRYMSHHKRRRRALLSPSSTTSSPLHHALRNHSSLSSSTSGSFRSSNDGADRDGAGDSSSGPDPHQLAMIESLPLFTLASSTASATLRSSADCAVCLSRFDPEEQLRLLPACRHAFHSACIDAWLRSTMSCPLCRSAVFPIPKSDEDIVPPTSQQQQQGPQTGAPVHPRSGSFRLEIGSVSRRTNDSAASSAGTAAPAPPSGLSPLLAPQSQQQQQQQQQQQPHPAPPHGRSYSLGSSFEYVVEDEIEAVVAAVAAHVRHNSSIPALLKHHRHPSQSSTAVASSHHAALAPGDAVAEAAGGGSGRGWLKDYIDRLASSASSSFSSLRFSGRWSRRSDGGGGTAGGSWDLEGAGIGGNQCSSMAPVTGEESSSSTQPPYYSFYRWLVGGGT